MQKMADMERLLSSSVLKKIVKKGSENPEADLNSLIGIKPVKQKTMEMAARMKFEQEMRKEEKKKGKVSSSGSMSGRHMVFYGSAGTGKAQPMYSKVLTPDGFVQMSDIKAGDKVISGNNQVSTVLGVYPQGEKDIYELTFDDGSTCRCSDEHLWIVQNEKDRQNGTYQTIELKEILKQLTVKHGNTERKNYSVDYVEPIDFAEKDFYIHPYLLGLLIGDGCLQNDRISISLYDKQLREDIYKFLPEDNYELTLKSQYKPDVHDYTIKQNTNQVYHIGKYANMKPLNYHLELLGLRGKKSHEKFIPKEYLYASREQRLWLLKGLLDTDGYTEKTGIEFTTASEQLKDDVIELLHSLGGYASYKIKQGSYSKDGKTIQTKSSYRLRIQFPEEYSDCFNLKRKSEQYQPKREKRIFKRFITDIKYIGKEECQCIYIDNPAHTYITDNYIITHNTTVARIITGFLYQYGYIKENKCVEINGNFLKAGSESGVKTKLICQKAFDGVLFIDEAYSIIEGTGEYGREVIATLIKEMEDNRDRFVLILAGYKNDMNRLLSTNEGFKSRIKEYLYFPDYDVSEMSEIFELMAHEQHFEVSQAAFDNFAVRIQEERKLATFGDGRTVRNVLDESIDRHALHYGSGELSKFTINGVPADDNAPAADCKYLLCGIDVSTEINKNVL